MNDISAYNRNEDLFVEVNNDTHILVPHQVLKLGVQLSSKDGISRCYEN